MENQTFIQPSNAALLFQAPPSKKANSLSPLSHRGKIMNEQIHPDDVEILNDTQSGKFLNQNKQNYSEHQVPIVKIEKKNSKVSLVPKSKIKQQIIARGVLIDFSKSNNLLKGTIDFQGIFKGIFQKQSKQIECYFEGEISSLTILKINGQYLSKKQKQQLADFTQIRGYFKGIFLKKINSQQKVHQNAASFDNLTQKIIKEASKVQQGKPSKVQYHVPTLVRMNIRKISQINLEKSSAQIIGGITIDVQLNKEVSDLIYNKDTDKFYEKYKLNIDFHRGKPCVLPFYDPQNQAQTDQEQQYEWDDVWEGIDLQVQWNKQLMRMTYQIRTTYTAEIDNSHGIFYAPFNLNVLRIVIDFHSIKIDSNTKICLNCCELTDFNQNNGIRYTPYTYFNSLQKNLEDKSNHEKMYKKHIDRLNKIDTTHFVDQGEFKVANNRLSLFPYHKRVFKNKNNIISDVNWTVGSADKSSLLETPEVFSVKQNFENYLRNGQNNIFTLDQWEFIHIQIPIFKYPVIDIIRIFVPITILSAISLTIFWQENANDFSGFTQLAKRIASGCSLMIAYVALIPMIRQNLPPTPSITLIQILIYLSVIPNFLAIVSTLITTTGDTNNFFATYQAFIDPLFLISFIICCVSLLILGIMIISYSKKDYKSDFTIYKFQSSPLANLRAPTFLKYIQEIKQTRKQYLIYKLPIPYSNYQESQPQTD